MTFERTIDGVRVPAFLYGTAWKEGETERLVLQALEAGFRGIDTANLRKHYHEAGVGAALKQAFAKALVRREELFLQTKFTPLRAQDERLPYDPKAPVRAQVHQSFDRSLQHLGVEAIDSLAIHAPSVRPGLGPDDYAAWDALEELHRANQVRLLGVSNFSREQLDLLLQHAKLPISFVQNQCHARTGWDREVREACTRHSIVYQAFSLLTVNEAEIASPTLQEIAAAVGLTPAQTVFRFALQSGMLPLTGTGNRAHMEEDLAVPAGPSLTDEQVRAIESISERA